MVLRSFLRMCIVVLLACIVAVLALYVTLLYLQFVSKDPVEDVSTETLTKLELLASLHSDAALSISEREQILNALSENSAHKALSKEEKLQMLESLPGSL